MNRTAYKLVNFAQQKIVSIDEVVAEVSIAYLNLKNAQLVGPSKPVVDNLFEDCNLDDPAAIDNLLLDIGDIPSKHPSHLPTMQNQS